MKAVQRDSGQVQVNMVADIYSGTPDDDRKRNAELFEEVFYVKKNLNPRMADKGTEKKSTIPDEIEREVLR